MTGARAPAVHPSEPQTGGCAAHLSRRRFMLGGGHPGRGGGVARWRARRSRAPDRPASPFLHACLPEGVARLGPRL